MKLTPLPDVEPRPRRVAVGTFDGVHLGHREVIRGADTVLTFEPHPAAIVSPTGAPRLLTPLQRKVELIADLGVQELVVVPFDREFASRSAESFIDDVLVSTLRAEHVSVGENFRFGHKAKGDTQRLLTDDRFQTRIVPLLEVDGEVVSSSHIRGLVLGGAVEYADKLLGAPFTFSGEVTEGDKRGRTLGFPTANIALGLDRALPAYGIYVTRAYVRESAYESCTSIGIRPTFDVEPRPVVETFILDFDEDIYGREMQIDLLHRLRGEERFASAEGLIAQMHKDIENTREWFKANG